MTIEPIHIIGGGMAGSEAAWQAANMGVPVILHEMRGVRGTEAHQTDKLAELVCSNSFRSDDHTSNAVGVLHEEMRRANGLIITKGGQHSVPAGSALAVDREGFSEDVTATLEAHPNITIVREAIDDFPPEDWDSVIIATGPLASASRPRLRKSCRESYCIGLPSSALHRESVNFGPIARRGGFGVSPAPDPLRNGAA